MPVDELPMYPTPQQASYVVGSPPVNGRRLSQPKPTTAYRPPKQYQSYPQPSQQQQHHQPAPIQQYAPTPQQYYQPQPSPQPPIQYQQPQHQQHAPQQHQQHAPQQHQQHAPQQHQQHAPQQHQQHAPSPQQHAPPPQQHAPPPQQYAPATQQYYLQPLPSSSHFLQAPLPPPPQQPQQQQRYDFSPQQPHQDPYSTSLSLSHSVAHKKPPPLMSSVSMGSTSSQGSSKATKQKPAEQKQKVSSKQLELELRAIFDAVDSNHSGKISAKELSSALSNFDNTRFQDSTIILMIRLFSSSSDLSSGPLKSLNFDQFVQLWKYLSVYKKLFVLADTNRSGDISFGEFQKVLTQIGYKLNVDLVLNLFQKFANKSSGVSYDSGISVGKLKFDAFIELLVYLRKLTDVFKKYDTDLSGVATISFSDFLFEVSNLS